MIQQIADSIADPGQATLEVQGALMQPLLASDAAVKNLAPGRPAVQAAMSLTIADLKKLRPKPLHSGRASKTLDWAIDQFTMDDADDTKRQKFNAYRKALDKLCESKGKGKGNKGIPVFDEFKRICDTLGVTFDPKRLGDLCKLFAVLQATGEGFDT
jgi:hypothetical protein